MDFLGQITEIFEYEEEALLKFKEKTYEAAFQRYEEEISKDFDASVMECYQALHGADEVAFQMLYEEIAKAFVQAASPKKTGLRQWFKGSSVQYDHNMYMIGYVFPHLLKEQFPYGKQLATVITEVWSNAFKHSNIQAESYETVLKGFEPLFMGFKISKS